ncbi:MAG: pilus assembly protein [Hyphomicrobiales bacterium]
MATQFKLFKLHPSFGAFWACEKGSNAVEFALVVPMFLAVIFSIFEVGFVFLTDLAIESALGDASRLIRTGQAQNTGVSPEGFADLVFDNSYGLIKRDSLNIDVDVFESFDKGNQLPPLLDEDGKLADNSVFNMGTCDSIIVIRSTYIYDILNPLGKVVQLSNYGDNQYLQVHIVAFKNEPYNGC